MLVGRCGHVRRSQQNGASVNGGRLGCALSGLVPKDMREKLKEVSKKIGVKKDGQKVAGLGNLSYREEDGLVFLSATERTAMREAFQKLAYLR